MKLLLLLLWIAPVWSASNQIRTRDNQEDDPTRKTIASLAETESAEVDEYDADDVRKGVETQNTWRGKNSEKIQLVDLLEPKTFRDAFDYFETKPRNVREAKTKTSSEDDMLHVIPTLLMYCVIAICLLLLLIASILVFTIALATCPKFRRVFVRGGGGDGDANSIEMNPRQSRRYSDERNSDQTVDLIAREIEFCSTSITGTCNIGPPLPRARKDSSTSEETAASSTKTTFNRGQKSVR